ncbi:hypothetical protein GQ42DRAFT_165413 [Ramicandelaber brevisporus]|nr:hypothetical protein GQ42DRAFT_165413 [Ramicandelaber brevisporus]
MSGPQFYEQSQTTAAVPASNAGQVYEQPQATAAATGEPLPPGWEVKHKEDGTQYFYHKEGDISQHEDPRHIAKKQLAESGGEGADRDRGFFKGGILGAVAGGAGASILGGGHKKEGALAGGALGGIISHLKDKYDEHKKSKDSDKADQSQKIKH